MIDYTMPAPDNWSDAPWPKVPPTTAEQKRWAEEAIARARQIIGTD